MSISNLSFIHIIISACLIQGFFLLYALQNIFLSLILQNKSSNCKGKLLNVPQAIMDHLNCVIAVLKRQCIKLLSYKFNRHQTRKFNTRQNTIQQKFNGVLKVGSFCERMKCIQKEFMAFFSRAPGGWMR